MTSGYYVTDDLIAFLNARLDEEETGAKAASQWMGFEPKRPRDWTRLMCDPVIGPFGGQERKRDIGTGMYVGDTSDPARVLREVEAKRRITEAHNRAEHYCPSPVLAGRHGQLWTPEEGPCWTLRLLAAVYSGHPDYDGMARSMTARIPKLATPGEIAGGYDCGHPLHAVRGPACDGDHSRPYTSVHSSDYGNEPPEMPGWVYIGKTTTGHFFTRHRRAWRHERSIHDWRDGEWPTLRRSPGGTAMAMRATAPTYPSTFGPVRTAANTTCVPATVPSGAGRREALRRRRRTSGSSASPQHERVAAVRTPTPGMHR